MDSSARDCEVRDSSGVDNFASPPAPRHAQVNI